MLEAILSTFKTEILSLASGIWRRWTVMGASLSAHVFLPSRLHTTVLTLKGRTPKPYEIRGVLLRVKGIDLTDRMFQGWSGAESIRSTIIKERVNQASISVEFGLDYDGCQYTGLNEQGKPLKLLKGETVRFFMPVGCPILRFACAMPKNTSIVVVTTDGEKVIMKGARVVRMLEAVERDWGDKYKDFGWSLNLTTQHRTLPDTAIIGTHNDRRIRL